MPNTVSVERALFAHFNQPSGPSKPGAMWAVRVSGDLQGVVMVRTLFSCANPSDAERKEKSEKAVRFIVEKLEQGWKPEGGSSFELPD